MKPAFVLLLLFITGFQLAHCEYSSVRVLSMKTSATEDELAAFICHVDQPLSSCMMKPPNSDDWISLSDSDIVLKTTRLEDGARYLYLGDGLEEGDCGIAIPNSQLEDNGSWTCRIETVGEVNVLATAVNIEIKKKDGVAAEESIVKKFVYQMFESSEESSDEDEDVDDSDEEEQLAKVQKDILNEEANIYKDFKDTSINKEFGGDDLQETDDERKKILNDDASISNEDKNAQEIPSDEDTILRVIQLDTEPYFGKSAAFICRTNKPLQYCLIQPPYSSDWISFNDSSLLSLFESVIRNDLYKYDGMGLESGDCGVLISNPRPQDNGIWTCKTKPVGESASLIGQVTIKIRDSLSPAIQDIYQRPIAAVVDSSEEDDSSEEEEQGFGSENKNSQRTHTLTKEQVEEERLFIEIVFIALASLALILFGLLIAVAAKELAARRMALKHPIYTGPIMKNGYTRLHPESITSMKIKSIV